jgi:hypothetical protein
MRLRLMLGELGMAANCLPKAAPTRRKVAGAIAMFLCVGSAALGQAAPPADARIPPSIVIGFMGGNVASDDASRNELIVANRLRASYPEGSYVQVFANRDFEDAHKRILQLLGPTPTSDLSSEDKKRARIVLYGHSWGASAVVTLANELKKDGIPVLLTIQVDSVQKRSQNDAIIPGNVERAANFFQPNGMLHGRNEIRAADPEHTTILGNFRYSYKEAPAECHSYPWYERVFIKTHIAIECDPVLWKRIEVLIRGSLDQPAEQSAGLPSAR